MFEIGLSGQMFDSCSVWEHLEAAESFGYKSIELRGAHINPSVSQGELLKVRDFLIKNRIKVNCLSCFAGNYGLLSDEECEKGFELFCQYVQLALFFDSDMVRVWPAWQESASAPEEIWEKAVFWMQKSADYAADFDKKLVMEMHHGTLCDTVESSLKLLERINRDNVGLTLDPVNLYQVPADYGKDAIGRLGKYIFNVHIKDIIELKTKEYEYAFPYSYYAKHIGRFTPVSSPTIKEERYFAHRRINQGGVDWSGVIKALKENGYKGYLIVESVSETNKAMPSGRSLAKACYKDVMSLLGSAEYPQNWNIPSPTIEGLHEVISPKNKDCKAVHAYRLNLFKGQEHILDSGALEMNAVLIKGSSSVKSDKIKENMSKYDSFYIPGNTRIKIKAKEESVYYIGAALYEGIGSQFFRKFQDDLPIGEINQIHGHGISERKVAFTLNPEVPASRLICGLTWGGDGSWTSWPPHQHEKHLEEVYCYFDMPDKDFALHISYKNPGKVEDLQVHVVKEGHMVLVPYGYHPTVASPGCRSTYFWVLAAFSTKDRRYDLAIPDPDFNDR